MKRKLDDQVSYASVAAPGSGTARSFVMPIEKIELINTNIASVTSLCEKMETAISAAPENPLNAILTDVSAAIKLLNTNHTEIMTHQVQAASEPAPACEMVNLGTIPKRNRVLSQAAAFEGNVFPPTARPPPPRPVAADNVRPEVKKFRDAVANAEKSTLIFNLDMGRIPIMNTATMSNRATLALAAMAAENEKCNGPIPTEDTVATIDDILSSANSIEFFGKKTKTYINNRDAKSGSYCTVPVRYSFSDKETKFEAEKFLRSKCGAHCSTPYPTILRECIRQVSDKVRQDFPGNQVKVSVDSEKFCLRVAKRQQPEGDEKIKWDYFERTIPLPDAVLDVDARKVPENFRVVYLPPGPDRGLGGSPVKNLFSNNETSMEVSQPNSDE
jgi:hypothetical protein